MCLFALKGLYKALLLQVDVRVCLKFLRFAHFLFYMEPCYCTPNNDFCTRTTALLYSTVHDTTWLFCASANQFQPNNTCSFVVVASVVCGVPCCFRNRTFLTNIAGSSPRLGNFCRFFKMVVYLKPGQHTCYYIIKKLHVELDCISCGVNEFCRGMGLIVAKGRAGFSPTPKGYNF